MKKVILGFRALDILNIGTYCTWVELFINVFRFESHMYIISDPSGSYMKKVKTTSVVTYYYYIKLVGFAAMKTVYWSTSV